MMPRVRPPRRTRTERSRPPRLPPVAGSSILEATMGKKASDARRLSSSSWNRNSRLLTPQASGSMRFSRSTMCVPRSSEPSMLGPRLSPPNRKKVGPRSRAACTSAASWGRPSPRGSAPISGRPAPNTRKGPASARAVAHSAHSNQQRKTVTRMTIHLPNLPPACVPGPHPCLPARRSGRKPVPTPPQRRYPSEEGRRAGAI